ncbi:cation diffusion facilitator family transporter [Clostridium sardiniense]|uniref:Cation diffusion facilitator family transporter n=1 Tax=Clostridium sardiniense TaxID=29369 RepID=A0ABS7KSU3_CLOSR|nr:cation diffusion facilitator family transporter [Clostridium sardiniense]MBY0753876.1 cation diffusion facilitator family transporter [Clostridium sardiniense]MDQ0459609.1 cation diffusion facilitator family transporter [Clostridium sardiniense]
MLSNLLVKTFIKNNENTKDKDVRNNYGFLGGIIGIIVNLILFMIKFTVGMLVSSIAVTADAFNNLSDAGSSVITIAGFKMANMPADEKHPFGHGRMEYLSALVVAFMVMLVGFQFVRSSFERILNPELIKFEWIPFILLIISIFLKFWLSRFNKFIGNRIDSSALKAASVDALGDVFTSTCVAISLLAAKFTTFPIDGYIGIVVALFIVYSGFSLVRETINPLLGEAPDPELVKDIETMMLSYDNITGVHDLIVHNYGPGRCMASAHAEIPSDIDIMEIHNIIDKAEREISKKLNIYLVIHMDPICLSDDEVNAAYKEVNKIIKYNPLIKSMHDFRIVGEGNEKNLIFDIVVNSKALCKVMDEEDLKKDIIKSIKEIHPNYNCVITVDHDYSND